MYAINIYAWLSKLVSLLSVYDYFLGGLQIYAVKLWMWEKKQCIISKNKINQLINQLFDKIIDQSINHHWGFIDDWGGKEKKKFRVRFRNIVVTKLGG